MSGAGSVGAAKKKLMGGFCRRAMGAGRWASERRKRAIPVLLLEAGACRSVVCSVVEQAVARDDSGQRAAGQQGRGEVGWSEV